LTPPSTGTSRILRETYQADARLTRPLFNLKYYRCENLNELAESLPAFLADKAGILEILTRFKQNAAAFF